MPHYQTIKREDKGRKWSLRLNTDILEIDPRFASVVYLVQLNSFELMEIWKQYNKQVQWEQGRWSITVPYGKIADREMTMHVMFEKMFGFTVAVYEPQSSLREILEMEKWWEVNCLPRYDDRHAMQDANNFHNMYRDLEEMSTWLNVP
jgi:hypothetical protein